MKKIYRIIICLAALLFAIPSSWAKPETMLWKIEKGDKKVYLLGSIHLATPDIYPFKNSIMDAFKSSDELVLEIDLNNIPMESIMSKMMYGEGDTMTLQKRLKPETYQLLSNRLSELGLPAFMVNKFKPWAVYMTMQNMELMASEAEVETQYGIDTYLAYIADSLKIKTGEIESVEMQLGVLEKLDEYAEELISFELNKTEDSTSESDSDMLNGLLKAWKDGDIEYVENYLQKSNEETPNSILINKVLITDRNVNMTSKLEEYLKTPEVEFIVVGMGHVVGKGGIIDLLTQSKKYVITRY